MPATIQVNLEDLARKIRDVFPVPKVLAKILEVVNDPQATIAMLEQVFKYEPSFSLKILTLANSAYYGSPSKVSNIRTAITLLGFNLIKSLVIHASVNEHFRFDSDVPGFSGAELWKHSVGVGACAKMISRRLRLGNAEDFFTLGLLHDMGLIIEYMFYREEFLAAMRGLAEAENDLTTSEQTHLGTDHAKLAKFLFERWALPELLVHAVALHHSPLEAPDPMRSAACALALANDLVKDCRFGFHYGVAGRTEPGVLKVLGLKALDLDVLREDFEQEALQLTLFLN